MKQDLVELYSPLPPDDCRRRLQRSVRPPGYWWPFDWTTVVGSVPEQGEFELWMAHSPRRYQSGAPHLTAVFEPQSGGTAILGEFALARTTLGLASLWAALLIVASLGVWVAVGYDALHGGAEPWYAFVLPFMFLFGAYLALRPTWYLMGDRKKLLAFLERTVDAKADGSTLPRGAVSSAR